MKPHRLAPLGGALVALLMTSSAAMAAEPAGWYAAFDIGGHWLQGGFALVTMYDFLHGKPVPADQANVKLTLLPLTQDKVAQFEKDFPNGVPAYDFKAHSRVYNPDAKVAFFEMKYSQ